MTATRSSALYEGKDVVTSAALAGSESTLAGLIGESTAMQNIRRSITTVAQNHSTVLLVGESGTGKELLAQLLHRSSPRTGKSFVAINCGALPESILESQLFGHVKGAFTGAHQDTLGVFRAANGGTVFLDEVTEMPIGLQVRLLRVLQEREVTPVGGTEPIKVDVRVVAATNRDVQAAIREGRLREDLYFRLSVVTLAVPALRERGDDIHLLTDYFNRKHATSYGQHPPRYIDSSVRQAMAAYLWPGNVRELSNALERCYALQDKAVIELADLPAAISVALANRPATSTTPTAIAVPAPAPAPHFVPPTPEPAPRPLPSNIAFAPGNLPTLEEVEMCLIREALIRTGGRKNDVARMLDVERHRLYRKIKKYNLEDCWKIR